MSGAPRLDSLYRDVGAALHTAQIAEYTVVSIYLLLIRTGPVEKAKERLDSYWHKKALGQLLDPVLDSGLLSDDAARFLETFRNARNHLAHSFFLSDAAVQSTDGVARLSREVAAMQEVFERALQFFDHLLSELARPLGIDVDEVKAQARAEVAPSTGD